MSFGKVIELLKKNISLVAIRPKMNGLGIFLENADGVTTIVHIMDDCKHTYWVPSHADILAEDWLIVSKAN